MRHVWTCLQNEQALQNNHLNRRYRQICPRQRQGSCPSQKRSYWRTTVAPSITERSDAHDEADRINLLNQAVIGAKEGFVEAITNKVGAEITGSVLKTVDGSDYKGVDDYQLEDLLGAVLQGADRPSGANVELLTGKTGALLSYVIRINKTQLALVTLANIEQATTEDW